jgi:Family of unknown function (DUF5985)
MSVAVYILCALTSLACAVLLLRSYLKTRTRLLLWSSLCFIALAVNNVLLFVDLVVVPNIDLSLWRHVTTLCGLSLLLYGLIWDTE